MDLLGVFSVCLGSEKVGKTEERKKEEEKSHPVFITSSAIEAVKRSDASSKYI